MTALSEAAIRQYREQAFYAPLRQQSHLLFTWLNGRVRHPRILTCVQQVAGQHVSATRVRGEDRFHTFAPEPRLNGQHARIRMRGTGKAMRA